MKELKTNEIKETMQIQISVIIPMFNVEAYIQECIESVILQKNVNMELICIDDGSEDSTFNIVSKYANDNECVKLYTQDNKGLSATRNRGIELASGKYLFFLDGDDKVSDDRCLSKLVDTIGSRELDFIEFDASVFFDTEDIHRNNISYEKMYQRDKSYGFYKTGKELFLKLRADKKYYCSSCIRLYRKDFLKENHLYFRENILYEDNIHTLACYMHAGAVEHINNKVMQRRVRDNSITQSPLRFNNFISYVMVYQEIFELWKSNNDLEMEHEFEKLCNEYKESAEDTFYKLTCEERKKINEIDPPLKYAIRSVILNDGERERNTSFPYHLFFYDDQIMIYGAGKIGKSFYREAINDRIVNIAGIVDVRGDDASEPDVKVDSIDAISNHLDMKWLISIEDTNIAQNAKDTLLSSGVSKDLIYWDGDVYGKRNASRLMIENHKFIERLLDNKEGKKIYVLGEPEHGNLGDYAISLGETQFLKHFFSEYEIVHVTDNEWHVVGNILKRIIKPDDIVLLPGGGFLGDLWESWGIYKQLIDCFPLNVKILFPNTMTYREQNWECNKSVEGDIQWLMEQKNIFIFLRDKYSYEFLKKYNELNCYYAPDMALYLQQQFYGEPVGKKSVLMCYRNDREKLIADIETIKNIARKTGKSVVEKDIHLNQYLPLEAGYIKVAEVIKEMKHYELVLTDRLHAMVMSFLAGTPCIAMDNLTRKLSGVYPWIKSDLICIVQSVDEINEDLIKKMIATKQSSEIQLKDEFDKMAKTIHEIIEINQ